VGPGRGVTDGQHASARGLSKRMSSAAEHWWKQHPQSYCALLQYSLLYTTKEGAKGGVGARWEGH